MCARRRQSSQNGEIPLSQRNGSDLPDPAARIEMGGAPEIDIANDQLGTLFIERRRTLGLKVEEVAEDIKIKADYLKAIEREEFELLPTPQYARLFVRAYAERLGFNPNEVYALLDVNMPNWSIAARPKHSAPLQDSTQLSGPLPGTIASAPPETRRRPSIGPMLIGIVVIVVVLGIIAWIVLGLGDDSATGNVPEDATTSQAALTSGGDITPEPASPVDAATPDATADSISAVAAETNWNELHLVITFDDETWASIQADGKNVANSIYQPGTTLEADGHENFRLSLGHTVGVNATVNGQPLRPFREWAGHLEGHLITRDSIQQWLVTEPETSDTTISSLQSQQADFVGPRES